MHLLAVQPFKGIYIVTQLLVLALVKIPFWLAKYSVRANRPHPAWSLSRCVKLYIVRWFAGLPYELKLNGARNPRKEVSNRFLGRARFQWIPPLPAELVVGEVADAMHSAGVAPARIPAYWYFSPRVALPDRRAPWSPPNPATTRVLYYVHGGGFVSGTAHPWFPTSRNPRGVLGAANTVDLALSVDYRIARAVPAREHPFPAALLDVLSGYRFLLAAGFRAENILCGGDSCGANLVLALVRYAHATALLPPPQALFLSSPWTDPSASRTASLSRNRSADMFPVPGTFARASAWDPALFGASAIRAYTGAFPPPPSIIRSPYVSPLSLHHRPPLSFARFPRTFILAAGMEMLRDDGAALRDALQRDGVDVVYDLHPTAVHDFLIFTWCEPERARALCNIGAWVDGLWAEDELVDEKSEPLLRL